MEKTFTTMSIQYSIGIMIVKQIESSGRESGYFSSLVNYFLNPQGKEHRIGQVQLSNFDSEDVEGALLEVIALQKKNTRAKSSDTMHLVVSFPSGEIPSKEVLEQVESRLANAIGLAHHQRISVTHLDTDHFHLHIAINKVDPKTFNLVSPPWSWTALARCALDCERDYNLAHDNHVVERVLFVDGKAVTEEYTQPESYIKNQKARDMEYKTETQSLTRFLKDEMTESLLAAKSWKEVHELLAQNGLVIKKKSRGFVFQSANSEISVKASSVHRELSFEKISQRLGVFIDAEQAALMEPWEPQKPAPSKLYLRYTDQRKSDSTAKFADIRHRAQQARREAKAQYLSAIAAARGNRNKTARDFLRAEAYEIYQRELQRIEEQRDKSIKKALQEKSIGWKEWVQLQAASGDIEALLYLRKKDLKLRKALSLESSEPTKLLLDSIERDSVTKHGTVIYRCGETYLKDTGQQLIFSNEYERQSLVEALRAAKEKFGDSPLKINGSESFRNDLLIVASSMKETLKFEDPKIQNAYEALKMKEIEDELKQRKFASRGFGNRSRFNRRSGDGGHDGRRVRGGEQNSGLRNGLGHSRIRQEVRDKLPEAVGKLPDTTLARVLHRSGKSRVSENDLLSVSDGQLDGQIEKSRMQMHGSLRAGVRHEGTGTDSSLRSVHGTVSKEKLNRHEKRLIQEKTCVDKYVADRNRRREFVSDVLEHKPFRDGTSSHYAFQGLRHIDGIALVLLQADNTIFVRAVSPAQVQFYKDLNIGTTLQVSGNQMIKSSRRR